MEVFGERRVPEELGLLVLGVFREREGVVSGDAAEGEEGGVTEVLAQLGVGGRGRRWRGG